MMKTIKYTFLTFLGAVLLSCTNNSDRKSSNENDQIEASGTDQPGSTTEVAEPTVHAEFQDENGAATHTKDLEGKVVFINFWATWCPPCLKEMPSIQVLYDKFKDNDNIEFLIVEIENDIDGAKKFLNNQNLSLPIVYPKGDIPSNWLGGAIPTTVILDKEGKTAAKQEGMYDFSTQSMEDFIEDLISQ